MCMYIASNGPVTNAIRSKIQYQRILDPLSFVDTGKRAKPHKVKKTESPNPLRGSFRNAPDGLYSMRAGAVKRGRMDEAELNRRF